MARRVQSGGIIKPRKQLRLIGICFCAPRVLSAARVSFGLWGYDGREQPLQTGGNVYYRGAEPSGREAGPTVLAETDPKVKLVQQGDRFILQISPGPGLKQTGTVLVTTGTLGLAKTPNLPYETADGAPLKVDTDYFGKQRSKTKPTAGPFENPAKGDLKLTVW